MQVRRLFQKTSSRYCSRAFLSLPRRSFTLSQTTENRWAHKWQNQEHLVQSSLYNSPVAGGVNTRENDMLRWPDREEALTELCKEIPAKVSDAMYWRKTSFQKICSVLVSFESEENQKIAWLTRFSQTVLHARGTGRVRSMTCMISRSPAVGQLYDQMSLLRVLLTHSYHIQFYLNHLHIFFLKNMRPWTVV